MQIGLTVGACLALAGSLLVAVWIAHGISVLLGTTYLTSPPWLWVAALCVAALSAVATLATLWFTWRRQRVALAWLGLGAWFVALALSVALFSITFFRVFTIIE